MEILPGSGNDLSLIEPCYTAKEVMQALKFKTYGTLWKYFPKQSRIPLSMIQDFQQGKLKSQEVTRNQNLSTKGKNIDKKEFKAWADSRAKIHRQRLTGE